MKEIKLIDKTIKIRQMNKIKMIHIIAQGNSKQFRKGWWYPKQSTRVT